MNNPRIADLSILHHTAESFNFLEKRMAYDGGGNLEYVGYNKTPNADTAAETWFIIKLSYTGTSVVRYQLPDDGAQFKYAWDDRATLFT